MTNFDPGRLRELRQQSGLSMAAIARKLNVSPAQVHRLEKGQRRITVDMLLQYCDALGVDISRLFAAEITVPIIAVADAEYEVLPLPPNTEYLTRAPNIVPDPHRLAAVRWEPTGRIARMFGHLLFFYADTQGVPDEAWGHRCVIRREQGTQRLGWPIRDGDRTHIDGTEGKVEFNADIVWASPILAVVPPFLLASTEPETPR